ncbi:unnamed protein product [Sphenostylis stenocarpa]|uniref:Peptide chain release factor domain-containing protein n=1 Tax=Sphenostylis stenocarpa TaxID=92480 RepID=A0AA86SNC0_9FABA|nr:unnamed protein product [Sphenostylis stenocarpa]
MSPPPWEALNLVATCLDPKTLAIASCVSKSWFSSLSSDHIWKPILATHFPSLTTLPSAVTHRRLFAMGYAAAALRSKGPPKPTLSLGDLVFAVSVSTSDGDVVSGVRPGDGLRMEAAGVFRFGVGCDDAVLREVEEKKVRVTWNVVLRGWGGVFTMVEREREMGLVGGSEGWFWQELPPAGCCSGAVGSAMVGDLKVGMCEVKGGNGVRVDEVSVGILSVVDWRYVSVEDGLRIRQHVKPRFGVLISFRTEINTKRWWELSNIEHSLHQKKAFFTFSYFVPSSSSTFHLMVMATMVSEPACPTRTVHDVASSVSSKWHSSPWKKKPHARLLQCSLRIRACNNSMANNKDIYKQVGLFSLKKKIEDAVLRAETFASTALEMEQATWIKQEEMVRDFDMWDDPAKSNDVLVKLANSAKVVDSLKDMKYKVMVEEAKLINQLAEINAIDCGLYKQAYEASLAVSEILDQYEISKLLKGPFDLAGACLVIKASPNGTHPKLWAEQLLNMYLRWSKRQGYEGRIVDNCPIKNGGINSATIEFEFGCAYGYLSGEKGVHHLIRGSSNESSQLEVSSATVDVIPMFFENSCDLEIDSEDLIISSPSIQGENKRQTDLSVCIQHVPTGISVQSSGERSYFANKMKALNRLKAKLLVTAREQDVASIKSIQKDKIFNPWQEETRRYVSHPYKLVHDVKTGIEVPDLNYVLEGSIGTLIAAHINSRAMS